MIQATRYVDKIDSEYLDKLSELVLFYLEYKEDNPTILGFNSLQCLQDLL